MEKVKIKNLTDGAILITLPNVRFRREFPPMQEVPVPEDVYEEFCYDTGCQSFIRDGFMQVMIPESLKDEVDPMVMPAGETTATVDVDKILTEGTVADLSKALKEGTPALQNAIVQAAMKLSVADTGRCNIIKHFTGVDILSAMAMDRK